MSSHSSVVKNSFAYTIGNLLLKAFSFFLIPLYTSYLSTEQYGILNLSSSFSSVVSMMLMMGLQYSVVRFFADYSNDKEKVVKMFSSVICFIFAFSLIISCLLILFRNYWSTYVFDGISFYPIVFLSILISVVQGLYMVYQDILKGMQDVKRSILLTYLFFFLLLGSNICTVVIFRLGALGILYSTLIVNSVMILLMFVDLVKRHLFAFTIDLGILKSLFKYSFPLVPHTMAYTVSNYATRIAISNKMSLSMLGVYSLSSQFGNLGDIILNSIQSAFQPWVFNRLNDCDGAKPDDIANTSYVLMWVYGLFFIIIGVFSQEAIILMADKSYIEAWVYVPFIVLSIAIKSPLYFYNNFIYYDKGKTKYQFYITVITSIICIVFTFLFVPKYGILGAVTASIISLIIRLCLILLVIYREAKRYYSIVKLHVLFIIPMLFMGVALIPSYYVFYSTVSIINITYKLLVCILYIVLIYHLYKDQILNYVMKIRHK